MTSNINKEFVRAVSHLMNSSQPLSIIEFREILLRHMISDPFDADKCQVTKHLLETYIRMMELEDSTDANIFLSEAKWSVIALYKTHFMQGFSYGKEASPASTDMTTISCPPILPLSMSRYPRDIIAQFGAVMGYKAAVGALLQ